MLDQQIIETIKEKAIDMDWHVAFGGRAKGNRHLFRVVTIAQFLAEKEKADGAICEAAAWLHDVSLTVGNDDNPQRVRTVAEKYLAGLTLDEESKKSIADCVETHEGAGEAASLEAKIVHDADVLDKMGLLGVIRHTWKIVNLIDPTATSNEVFYMLQQHLRERREKLYTATAKQLVRILNNTLTRFFADQPEAIKTLETIMQYAKRGVISDEIAQKLLSKANIQSLRSQLYISHDILQSWYIDL
jgi:uncharacterized protein